MNSGVAVISKLMNTDETVISKLKDVNLAESHHKRRRLNPTRGDDAMSCSYSPVRVYQCHSTKRSLFLLILRI